LVPASILIEPLYICSFFSCGT